MNTYLSTQTLLNLRGHHPHGFLVSYGVCSELLIQPEESAELMAF